MNAASSADRSSERPQFYGRRRGHKLRVGRQHLLETLLPNLRVCLPAANTPIEVKTLFDDPVEDVWLEVGFGAGEHIAAQAAAHSNIGFIGCEPFVNGVTTLLSQIQKQALANIRIFDDDARLLLPALEENSFGRVFLLFSDPWPKKRHNRRRFLVRETLDQLARLMKDGAELRFASDHMDYVQWALELIIHHPDFEWPVQSRQDWIEPPIDWAPTRYETKARARGASCAYLRIRRRPR